jgi:ADP-ribose pyrophosphatase
VQQPKSEETIAEGKRLRFVRRGTWEYVTRRGATGVVVVAAVTDEGKLLLVEQDRIPIGRRAIELPAGLAGDEPGAEHEHLVEAAKRELLEETGYTAARWQEVFTGPSSAGLTDEMITFFLASGLTRQSDGGGVAGEDILVHEVPLDEVDQWLSEKTREGLAVDVRVYTGLYFLGRARN